MSLYYIVLLYVFYNEKNEFGVVLFHMTYVGHKLFLIQFT